MDVKQFFARAMHVNVSILRVYISFNASTLVYKQFQVDFEILKVIFNKNFTSHIVSANSVYNGHNSLYLIPYPYVYAQQIRLTALLIICICMLFDARNILLPKRNKQKLNVSSEFVGFQLPIYAKFRKRGPNFQI